MDLTPSYDRNGEGLYGEGGKQYGYPDLRVLYLGSGGWGCHSREGGNGGGALKIECINLILNDNASITSNGGCDGNDYDTGSGSGGSIFIVGHHIIMKQDSIIEAKGGDEHKLIGDGFNKPIGKGGMGRIRIDFNFNVLFIFMLI